MKKERLEICKKLLSLLSTENSLLDLATGHGKFARLAKEMGYNVTAIDARKDRMPNYKGIKWIVDDLANINISDYQIVLCLGILYHLNDPEELVKRMKNSITILDTHFAASEKVEHLGYKGDFYKENRSALTSSFNDDLSFWPSKKELLRMLNKYYSVVMELIPSYMNGRTFFLLIP
jgi:SAM-dependent methyltransferase